MAASILVVEHNIYLGRIPLPTSLDALQRLEPKVIGISKDNNYRNIS